jgi:hypothetical protein
MLRAKGLKAVHKGVAVADNIRENQITFYPESFEILSNSSFPVSDKSEVF